MSGTPCLSGFWLLCYPIIPNVCACATRFAVWSVCVMRVTCVSDETDESDDDAQAAYVVAWEEERVMDATVFRHAENAVGMI